MIASPARRVRLVVAATAVLGLVATLAPVQAGTVLWRSTGTAPVWEAVVISTDGSKATAELALRDVALNVQFGIRVYKGDDVVHHANFGIRGAGERGVFVAAEPAPGITISHNSLDKNGDGRVSEVSALLTLNPDSAVHKGNLVVVMWGAGRNVSPYTFTVNGGSGVQVRGRTSGHSVVYATTRDFTSGTANVMFGHRDGERAVFARAQVGATTTITVKRTFIGDFYPDAGTASRLTVFGPQSNESCLPACRWTARSGSAALGPGAYRFQVDGTGATQATGEVGDVVLSGIDATLPRP